MLKGRQGNIEQVIRDIIKHWKDQMQMLKKNKFQDSALIKPINTEIDAQIREMVLDFSNISSYLNLASKLALANACVLIEEYTQFKKEANLPFTQNLST
jgi:hypothetical protein